MGIDKINLIQKLWDHELAVVKNNPNLSEEEKREKMEAIRDKWSPSFRKEISSIEGGMSNASSVLIILLGVAFIIIMFLLSM